MQTAPLSPAEVQEALEAVYRRPELAPRQETWSLWAWIGEQVARFFSWLNGLIARFSALEETAPVLFWAVIAWLVATALAIVAHLVITAVRAGRSRETAAVARSDVRRAAGARTAADWEAAARAAAAGGRWRDGALALYQALVLRLDARGAVRFDPAKTPGDYRREARAHPEAARALAAFLRDYEPVAFGARPLDDAGYRELAGAARQAGADG